MEAEHRPAAIARTYLQQATASRHHALEEGMGLLSEHLHLDAYIDTLRRLHPIYAELETALAAHAPALAGTGMEMAPGAKTSLLNADLAWFEATAYECRAAPPGLPSVHHAWGCLYVLEGANLGGRLIARHVAQRLGLHEETGLAFFTRRASLAGLTWPRFVQAMERAVTTPSALKQAANSAMATFDFFAVHLVDTALP